MSSTDSPVGVIDRAKCISLTTVKRIRSNPQVEFATCTQRGKVTGPVFTGTARIISAEELAPVLKARRRRYLSARFIQLLPSARDQVGIEVVPDRPTTPDAS